MATETLIPENRPNILEDPTAFVRMVADLSSYNSRADRDKFKSWLEDQWTKINDRISNAPFQMTSISLSDRARHRLRDKVRVVRISDELSLSEEDLNEEAWGDPKVKLNLGNSLMLSPDNKKHWTRVHFLTNSKAERKLTTVFMEDRYIEVNLEEEAFEMHIGFEVKLTPHINIQQLAENVVF